jgi:hypothetical protein
MMECRKEEVEEDAVITPLALICYCGRAFLDVCCDRETFSLGQGKLSGARVLIDWFAFAGPPFDEKRNAESACP